MLPTEIYFFNTPFRCFASPLLHKRKKGAKKKIKLKATPNRVKRRDKPHAGKIKMCKNFMLPVTMSFFLLSVDLDLYWLIYNYE